MENWDACALTWEPRHAHYLSPEGGEVEEPTPLPQLQRSGKHSRSPTSNAQHPRSGTLNPLYPQPLCGRARLCQNGVHALVGSS